MIRFIDVSTMAEFKYGELISIDNFQHLNMSEVEKTQLVVKEKE